MTFQVVLIAMFSALLLTHSNLAEALIITQDPVLDSFSPVGPGVCSDKDDVRYASSLHQDGSIFDEAVCAHFCLEDEFTHSATLRGFSVGDVKSRSSCFCHFDPGYTGSVAINGAGTGQVQNFNFFDGLPSAQCYRTDRAEAVKDPHLVSVSGEKFDVNQPGGYTLIRVPMERWQTAMLEINASLQATDSSPCGLYIQQVQISGAWLGDSVVRVLPLQRNMPGSNGAGNGTLRPFSLEFVGLGGLLEASEPWGFNRSLSGRVRVLSSWRQAYADKGNLKEAEAFQFFIRGRAENEVSVEVSQAPHQSLDVRAGSLRNFGFKQLGGLLGTEGHDRQIERPTSACATSKAGRNHALTDNSVTRRVESSALSDAHRSSSMTASWDASQPSVGSTIAP